ncbi:trio and f-actin-binding protein [Plakobranchus ocellatus]|uniref:Trio and f-actin-binding protein n=1 Tax=Plakobranchus ocellatus TaxID=259542 RepID=A0AAV3ZEJ7_9GAST|nr:trio and f-actin-binding protein [Plakobranchus ocellatus]
MTPLCKRLRKATVLRELIRDCRNGENVEFGDRVQIEDDVVDVFNIQVVGDSAVVDVPHGESAIVDDPDEESAGVYIPYGERAIVDVPGVENAGVDVPDGERAIVDVPDGESAIVDIPDGESAVITLKFGPVRTKGQRKGQDRTSRFALKKKLAKKNCCWRNCRC